MIANNFNGFYGFIVFAWLWLRKRKINKKNCIQWQLDDTVNVIEVNKLDCFGRFSHCESIYKFGAALAFHFTAPLSIVVIVPQCNWLHYQHMHITDDTQVYTSNINIVKIAINQISKSMLWVQDQAVDLFIFFCAVSMVNNIVYVAQTQSTNKKVFE